ncbi:MAG: peroxidase family protein [bacterium]|nr:peroxidase family protein [bacterium]
MSKTVIVILIASSILCFDALGQEFRTLDGIGTNISNPIYGSADAQLLRIFGLRYDDDISEPISTNVPNSRLVSNAICHQDQSIPDRNNLSDYFWCFGQFLDHDIVINRGNSGEVIIVNVPTGDIFFDPSSSGNRTIQLSRSKFVDGSGTSSLNPRQHVNEQTAFIDGSVIYGVDGDRLEYLRTLENGKFRVSEGNNLPFNTVDGEYNSDVDFNAPLMEVPSIPRPSKFYMNGDIRANENPGLLALHTLFVREHNRLCDSLAVANPSLNDEQLFQYARKFIGAYLQSITYNEWLPSLGIDLEQYSGYNPEVDPGISNMFSAAAFRFGHSLVNEQILRLDNEGNETAYGMIQIAEAFFNADKIVLEGGVDPILKGMSHQIQQDFDPFVVGSLRNFLFGNPSSNGLDLAVLNIERGRERGVPRFNDLRRSLGLVPYSSFIDLAGNEETATNLSSVYGNIEDIDPWLGFLVEKKLDNQMGGETFIEVLSDQFSRMRDGDRFWYENDTFFNDTQKEQISNTTLSAIIKRNTSITNLAENVFVADPNFFIVTSSLKEVKSLELSIYPNPVSRNMTVTVGSYSPLEVQMQFYNLDGKMFIDEFLTLERGNNEFNFEITKWNLYFCSDKWRKANII